MHKFIGSLWMIGTCLTSSLMLCSNIQAQEAKPQQEWVVRIAQDMPANIKAQALQDLKLAKKAGNQSYQRTILAAKEGPHQLTEWDFLKTKTSQWSAWIELEPDLPYYIEEFPDDSLLDQQWTVKSGSNTDGLLNLGKAWDLHTGSRTFIAGIIDTGIDYTHEDLGENIWQNLAEDADGDGHTVEQINGVWQLDSGDLDGIDSDQNGYTDDLIGWDFVDNDNDPLDLNGHGTHVAGIMGAKGNNQIGIAGINWDISLMALKAFDQDGRSSLSAILEALAYARENGAHLTNNSWGGSNYSEFLYDEIEEAEEVGQLLIAAAGNAATNLTLNPVYPASYDLPNIIAVGASDQQDQLAPFSNYGINDVDVIAPGVAILSTLPNNQYGTKSGTSMATPAVAGAIGLLWSYAAGMGHLDIKNLFLSTVDIQPGLSGTCATSGRVNAYEGLRIATDLCVDWITHTKGHHMKIKSLADDGVYIWAATDDGLMRLHKNNCQFDHFEKNNSPLTDDHLLSVEVGMNGEIWIGTEKKGLIKIQNDVWTNYKKENSGLPDNKISALLTDESGGIWVGTDQKGLAYFDGIVWTVYNKSNSCLDNDKIKAMIQDVDGSLWVGTDKGLAHFDNGTCTLIQKSNSSLPDDKVRAIDQDEEDNLWIGTENGLARWGSDGWEIVKKENSVLPDNKLRSITIGRDSIKWFGTKKGLARYDGTNWTLFDKKTNYLPHDAVNSLETDGFNNTWAGTDDGIQVFTNQASVRFTGPPVACLNSPVDFVNHSIGADSYQWKIDGTIVSTDANLNHAFTTAGNFEVQLIGINEFSSSGFSMLISVSDVPSLSLGPDTTVCASALVLDAGKDMPSYTWESLNGQALGNDRTLMIDQSGSYVLKVNDGCNQVAKDSIHISLNPGCVWPGDVNADGKVNMIDYLCLGQVDGLTGIARTDTSTLWKSISASDWASSFPATHELAAGVNHKHADTNGDGLIDIETDGAVILKNLIYSHEAINVGNQEGAYVEVVPVGTQYLSDDTALLQFEVFLKHSSGQALEDVYGLAFSFESSHDLASTPSIDVTNSWLAPDASIITHQGTMEHPNALNQTYSRQRQTDIAMTRTDLINTSGNGLCMTTSIIVTIDDLADDDNELSYSVFNIQPRRLVIVDSAGNSLPTIEWESSEISSIEAEDSISSPSSEEAIPEDDVHPNLLHTGKGITVYPNPTVDVVHLYWDATYTLKPSEIKVRNLSGIELFSHTIASTPTSFGLDVSHLSAGIYILELLHEGGVEYQKIVVRTP